MENYYTQEKFEKEYLNDKSADIYYITFLDTDGNFKNGFIIKLHKNRHLKFSLLSIYKLKFREFIDKDYLLDKIKKQLNTKYEKISKDKFYYSKIPSEFELINSYTINEFNKYLSFNEYSESINIEKLFKHLNLKLKKYEKKE